MDLASAPPAVDGELTIDMLDTHSNQPPEIEFGVNGTAIGRESLPRGGGDGSLNGRPGNARRHSVRVRVPAGALKAGRNVVTITNLKGSWFLYEHVALRLPGASAGARVRRDVRRRGAPGHRRPRARRPPAGSR